MLKASLSLLTALCLCLSLAACAGSGEAETTAATAPTTTAAATVPTEPTETTLPETEPTAQTTAPGEAVCTFFDDAAFVGDSITHTLMIHHTRTGDFGNALFFVRGSLGIHNTLNKQLKVFFQGQNLTPWDALKAAGVNKVFIMLGTNDIGYYGIDDTMEKWETFLANVRETCPQIQIYIQALTPMWSDGAKGGLSSQSIAEYNSRLETFAEENDCFFVDVTPILSDSTGCLLREYCSDFYVHMNYEGTAVWADFLLDYGIQQQKETE